EYERGPAGPGQPEKTRVVSVAPSAAGSLPGSANTSCMDCVSITIELVAIANPDADRAFDCGLRKSDGGTSSRGPRRRSQQSVSSSVALLVFRFAHLGLLRILWLAQHRSGRDLAWRGFPHAHARVPERG